MFCKKSFTFFILTICIFLVITYGQEADEAKTSLVSEENEFHDNNDYGRVISAKRHVKNECKTNGRCSNSKECCPNYKCAYELGCVHIKDYVRATYLSAFDPTYLGLTFC
ncbi:uncharacterized protein LOC122500859 [Leptopilina heterotoma]|uniref:uncharacterized protein LOC122500859 n=1 Tax=Leptopilina heterotoma TaxID=63436 RepID=UPI001CA979EB|nr:uncharacterized protein LOC122500859 [Leptopilina heterotoma]